MSSLLRRTLLRSESHYSPELASQLTQELEDSDYEEQHDEETPAAQPESGSPVPTDSLTEALTPKERKSGTTWQATTAVLLADMFGLGTLSLPADFARLGWLAGLAVTFLSAGGLLFSGLLFTRLSQLVPRAQTFADFGDAAMGRKGRRLVYVCVYTCIALEPVILQLICCENLLQILHHTGISQLSAGAIVAACMVPLSQIQTLDEISWLAFSGTIGMLVGVAIVFGKLIALPPAVHHGMVPVVKTNPRAAVTAILDIVFTYGGQVLIIRYDDPGAVAGPQRNWVREKSQVNWVRYVAGMKRRADFRYASTFAGVSMTFIYVALGLYGYRILGTSFDFEQPVTSIFENDAWVVAMNAGILVHCIIAYQINLNVWTDMALHLFTDDLESPEERSSPRGRKIWGLVTTLGIIYSLTLSQVWARLKLVPYFSLVMAIIAAVGDLTAAYALPALFCLLLSGPRLPLPRWQAVLCWGIIPVSLALSGVGLASSLWDLHAKLTHRFH